MGNYKFILSGGGTGGHIYPAIAIANELKRRHPQAEFLFVGASDRMEMEKVPQAGYPIKGLWISGLQRKISLKNLLFPIKLVWSLIKASSIVARFKPQVVIGTGGFASGPLIKAASFLNVPSVLQEQNSYAGITNKWLAPAANKICVAYDNMERYFPENKIRRTGNPVRGNIISQNIPQEEARKQFGLIPNKKTLLILGGSLGAKRINQLISENLEFFESLDIQLIWQCGKLYKLQYAPLENNSVKVLDFITEMGQAYAAADFVISRAGASSVSELCIVGKPVVFIPSPNVAEDHQTKNALALADKKAALLVREKELETGFQPLFKNLVASEEQLTELSKNIKQLALPKATEHIVDEIEALLQK